MIEYQFGAESSPFNPNYDFHKATELFATSYDIATPETTKGQFLLSKFPTVFSRWFGGGKFCVCYELIIGLGEFIPRT